MSKHTKAELEASMASLVELHATPGAMETRIKTHPALAQYVAQCFANLLADAPNYVEANFDLVVKKDDGAEWITVTVQKGSGKTPHQLRMEAEKQRDEALADYKELVRQVNKMADDKCPHCGERP